jgi:hypothetical protein
MSCPLSAKGVCECMHEHRCSTISSFAFAAGQPAGNSYSFCRRQVQGARSAVTRYERHAPDLSNIVSCTASASGAHSQLHVNDGQDVRAPGAQLRRERIAVICLAHRFTLPVLSSRRPTMPDSCPHAAHTAGGMPAPGTAAGRGAAALPRPPSSWGGQRACARQDSPHALGGRGRLPRLGAREGGWAAGQRPPALVSAGWRWGLLVAPPTVRAAPAARGRQAAPAWARTCARRPGWRRALHAGRPASRLRAPRGPAPCC